MTQRRAGLLVLVIAAAFAAFAPAPVAAQTTQCIANVAAQGTSDAITSAQLPCGTTTNLVILTAAAANVTTTPTYAPQGSLPLPITRADGTHVVPLDILPGYVALLSSTGTSWVLVNPATGTNVFFGTVAVTASPYNADPTGVADSSSAFSRALTSGALAIYVPPGTYKVCGVQWPTTANLHLYGAGDGSKIVQGNCGSPVFSWPTAAMDFNLQTISDLQFDSTAGNAHTIDTTGKATVTIRSVTFINTPAGHDNVYVNGTAGVQTHSIRLVDIQAYSFLNDANGFAKVQFGPLTADCSIDLMIAGGGGAVPFPDAHIVVIDSGAGDIQVNNSHLYNTSGNVVLNSGFGDTFNNDTLDFSSGADVFHNQGAQHTTIVGGYIEAIQPGFSGISSTASNLTNITNEKFVAEAGSVSAVADDVTSSYTILNGGDITVLANYSNVFDLRGTGSYAGGVPGYAPLNVRGAYNGTTTSVQLQNTTAFLGLAGADTSSYLHTAFTAGFTQTITGASIATLNTPNAGQTFTMTLYNGVTILGTCVIPNGSFGCTISGIAAEALVSDSIYILSAFSVTSGSTLVRYSITYRG